MKHDDIRKLLGGYATGTLTEDERRVLFEAAMEDQQLFDALADEEALRELLDDPAYRQSLVAELREAEPGVWEKIAAWWNRPLPLAVAGGFAAVALAVLVLGPLRSPEKPLEMAMSRDVVDELAAELEEVPPPAPKDTPPEVAEPAVRSIARAPVEKPLELGAAGKAPRRVSPAPASEPLSVTESLSTTEPKKEIAAAPPPEPTGGREKGDFEEGLMKSATVAESLERKMVAQKVAPGAEVVGAAQERAQAPSAPVRSMAAAYRDEAEADVAGATLVCTLERATADGQFTPVGPGETVGLEETIRLSVVSSQAGHIDVVESRGEGGFALLFRGEVEAGRRALVPSDGRLPAPTSPGERIVTVVFSAETPPDEGFDYFQSSPNATRLTIRYE